MPLMMSLLIMVLFLGIAAQMGAAWCLSHYGSCLKTGEVKLFSVLKGKKKTVDWAQKIQAILAHHGTKCLLTAKFTLCL